MFLAVEEGVDDDFFLRVGGMDLMMRVVHVLQEVRAEGGRGVWGSVFGGNGLSEQGGFLRADSGEFGVVTGPMPERGKRYEKRE